MHLLKSVFGLGVLFVTLAIVFDVGFVSNYWEYMTIECAWLSAYGFIFLYARHRGYCEGLAIAGLYCALAGGVALLAAVPFASPTPNMPFVSLQIIGYVLANGAETAALWVALSLLPLRIPAHQTARSMCQHLLVVAFLLYLVTQFMMERFSDSEQVLVATLAVHLWIGAALLLLRRKLAPRSSGRAMCMVGILYCAAAILAAIWIMPRIDIQRDIYLAAVSATINLAVPILMGLLALLEVTVNLPHADDDFGLISFTCPQCETSQEIESGDAQCAACGLCIHLEFEVPRCACGYRLYGRDVEACPECGRAVAMGAT